MSNKYVVIAALCVSSVVFISSLGFAVWTAAAYILGQYSISCVQSLQSTWAFQLMLGLNLGLFGMVWSIFRLRKRKITSTIW